MKTKKPKELFALVCQNGKVFRDEDDGWLSVFDSHGRAEEYLDLIGHYGWKCDCKNHQIVEYGAVAFLPAFQTEKK